MKMVGIHKVGLVNGNNKKAAFVGDTTTKKGAVSRVENGNIGICNGLACFVDDSARQMALCLMGTFHIDFPFTTLYDTDGIEAYKLDDGIWHGLTLHMCRYSEIFKFVVYKSDIVACGLFLNVF